MLPQRKDLVKGMIFENADKSERLVLDWKDNSNTWSLLVLSGDPNEYVRYDYIFTDQIHGYNLVGFMFGDQIFEK